MNAGMSQQPINCNTIVLSILNSAKKILKTCLLQLVVFNYNQLENMKTIDLMNLLRTHGEMINFVSFY